MARGCNEVLDLGNVGADSEITGDRYHGGGGGIWRYLECWKCGREHQKRNCPKRAEEKQKNKKDDGSANNKRAKVKGGQLYTMFTSSVDVQSGIDFSNMGEDDKFTWHQLHVEGWGL